MEPHATPPTTAKRLGRRAKKYLKRFAAGLDEISSRPDAIHGTRVSSRRLQQVFAVVFPKPRTAKQRKLIRILRRVRRRLSAYRSLDVTLGLIAETINEAGDRAPWEALRVYLEKERRRELKRAARKLSRYRTLDLRGLADKCLERIAPDLTSRDMRAVLQASLERARRRWQKALALAKQNHDPERLHALRIATKRLRYRAELSAEAEHDAAKVWVKELKGLQQNLGRWHDRHVLFLYIAEFVGRPDCVLKQPEIVRSFLGAIERERSRQTATAESIMSGAEKVSATLDQAAASSGAETNLRPVELWSHRRFARQRS